MLIDIQRAGVIYIAKDQLFVVSGKKVRFATTYKLVNSVTNKTMVFELSHSTGSEWDSETIWVYKNDEGYTLYVKNDDVTEANAEAYLQAKLRK